MATETESVHARLDRIEAALDRLTGLVEATMPWVAMATDTIDELTRGTDVDARVQAGAHAVERLTAPPTLTALGDMAAQAPKLRTAVGLAAETDAYVAMAADSVDAFIAQRAAQGDDVHARLEAVAGAVDTLTQPELLASLLTLAEHAPRLQTLAALAADAEPTFAMAADMAEEMLPDDIDERLLGLAALSATLTDPGVLAEVDNLLRCGVFDFARYAAEARNAAPAPVGPWGMWRALQEPDVQRGVAVVLDLTRRLGRQATTSLTRPR